MMKFWSKFYIQILWYIFTRNNMFPLTSSQSLPGKQENPSSSDCRHVSNSLTVFSLDSKFNNGWMKVQVKRAFKNYFLSQKNNKKADRLPHEIFFSLRYKCAERPISPIFCGFIFFEECLNPQVRINKMVNKHIADYHVSP